MPLPPADTVGKVFPPPFPLGWRWQSPFFPFPSPNKVRETEGWAREISYPSKTPPYSVSLRSCPPSRTRNATGTEGGEEGKEKHNEEEEEEEKSGG